MRSSEVVSLIEELSHKHRVPAPGINISRAAFRRLPNRVDAYFDPRTKTIYMRPDRLTRHITRHEFAHWLQELRVFTCRNGCEIEAERFAGPTHEFPVGEAASALVFLISLGLKAL